MNSCAIRVRTRTCDCFSRPAWSPNSSTGSSRVSLGFSRDIAAKKRAVRRVRNAPSTTYGVILGRRCERGLPAETATFWWAIGCKSCTVACSGSHWNTFSAVFKTVERPGSNSWSRVGSTQMTHTASPTSSVWLTPDGGVAAAETRHKVRLMEESTRSDHG